MDFEKYRVAELFARAKTNRGFTLEFPLIPKEQIVYHDTELSKKGVVSILLNNKETYCPTQLKLKCSFGIVPQMCDRLNNSKILVVNGYENKIKNKVEYDSTITIELLPMFSYPKFEDILYDLCVAFDLESERQAIDN